MSCYDTVLWALATADVTPQYSDTFDSLLQQKARPSPAKAESDPVTFVIALASQELMRRPADFKEQEIKDMLWSLSRVSLLLFVACTFFFKFLIFLPLMSN